MHSGTISINRSHFHTAIFRPLTHPPKWCIFTSMKILMVCLGNICRSPLAEGILQDKAWKAGLNWSVESAGTNGYHNGEAPHRFSQKVALLHGIDISRQRSRSFTANDLHVFDKIYALAGDVLEDIHRIARKPLPAGKVDLLLNELYPGKDLDVPDPWSRPEAEYHEVYQLIERACTALVEKHSGPKIL